MMAMNTGSIKKRSRFATEGSDQRDPPPSPTNTAGERGTRMLQVHA